MKQAVLFDRQNATLVPRDGHVIAAPDVRRLARQNAAILARLRQGPATNRDLAALALKYTSRVSDLRQAGYEICVVAHDHQTGCVLYRLVESS